LIRDDDVGDLALVERAELTIDAENARRRDRDSAQRVVVGESALDRFSNSGNEVARLACAANEGKRDSVSCEYRWRCRRKLTIANQPQRLLLTIVFVRRRHGPFDRDENRNAVRLQLISHAIA